MLSVIYFFDVRSLPAGWSSSWSPGHTSWHAAWHAAGHTSRAALRLHLGHDGVQDALELLGFGFVLGLVGVGVAAEPGEQLVGLVGDGLDVFGGERGLGLLVGDGLLAGVEQTLELVFGFDLLAHLLVLLLEALGLLDEFVDFVLGEAALLVFDLDVVGDALALLDGLDVEDAVGVDVEGDLDLRLAARHGRDALEVELAEQVVVLGHLALALEDLDADAGLVVGVGGEGL